MENMQAVAIFPRIEAKDLEEFKEVAALMMQNIQEQESILRYDIFFSSDNSQCVVLEEYSSPAGVIEHVTKNSEYLDKLTRLGGKIEGSVFPFSEQGEALATIKAHWDTKVHAYFAGKVRK